MTRKTAFISRHGSVLLALVLAAWQPAGAQRPVVAEGNFLHRPARAHYPERVGEYRRSEIYRYDEAGQDVSASYNLATPAGRLLITIYIYPAPPAGPTERAKLCEDEFATANKAISSQQGDAAPLERGPALAVAGARPGLGHRSVYRFATAFDGRVQEIRSEVHLYCYVGGDWLVKYRVSAPAGLDTRGPVETFIRDGPWPGRTSA